MSLFLNSLNFLVGKILEGEGAICPTPLPPVPTAMSNHANVEIVNTTELRIGASKWFQSVHRLRSRIYW